MERDSYWENQEASDSMGNRFWIATFLFVSLLACVAAALLVPGGLGFLAGYQELQAQNHEAAITHFNRGLGYLAENYPELARSEFEIALRFDGSYEPAQEKLRDLQPKVDSTPASPEDQVARTLFDEANSLVKESQWSDAIARLEQLRTLKANYRTTEVNDLLFQAYSNGGKAAVAAGQIELARERFEAALSIKSADREVSRQRDLAVLYLDGQQAVGYNWKLAIQKFSTLYQQDPNYDDVKKRLFDAYINYGDLAAKQGAPCLAVNQYDGALALSNDANVSQKRTSSMDRPCDGTGDITGFVRDALGRLMTGVPVGYYADGISMVATKTNANGQYQFVLGKDAGLFHVVILGPDSRTPSTLAADVQYAGGINVGCHIVVDWQRVQ
jgi:tetratricopeptide (TPR) repeat protein